MRLLRRSQEFTSDSEIIFFPYTNKLEREAKSSIVGGSGVLSRGRERKLRKVRQRRVAGWELSPSPSATDNIEGDEGEWQG
ncbi:hypothetical protein U1Q18_003596 [Sarracenia purpurea var. burkii]